MLSPCVQVALAEQLASHQLLQNQGASQMAAWQEKESELSNELRKLRISSQQEVKGLHHRLDKALQVCSLDVLAIKTGDPHPTLAACAVDSSAVTSSDTTSTC